ncbi:MAG: hypothetical protein V3T30_02550, partial [Thermodesulfobacteriota bacterium]
MGIVVVEVDIGANGIATATPNPVRVATGDNLVFHVNSNKSNKRYLTVTYEGGPGSPFGEVDCGGRLVAARCTGIGNHVNWPKGSKRGTVTLRPHSSPSKGTTIVEIIAVDTVTPAIELSGPGEGGWAGLREATVAQPTIVHNNYFAPQLAAGAELKGALSNKWHVNSQHP